MSSTAKTVLWIVVILAVLAALYFIFIPNNKAGEQQGAATTTANTTSGEQMATTSGTTGSDAAGTGAQDTSGAGVTVGGTVGVGAGTAASEVTVTYNGSSYSPASVTIKKGGTVKFVSTAGSMWVASDPHPSHTGYSGTSRSAHCPDTSKTAFDQCSAGTSYTFTFNKTGTWGYHNHLNDEARGVVIVQ